MKRIYGLLALVITAVIALNAVVLYILFTRPNLDTVQRMIDTKIQSSSQSSILQLSDLVKSIPLPSPGPQGEKGEATVGKDGKSIVGPPGANGKDGQSIVGPPGPKGEPGAPGRELEIRQDPASHEIYTRYTGDTAWTLVEAP